MCRTGRSIEIESKLVVARGWGGGGWGVIGNGDRVSPWDGESVLELVVMAAQLCEGTKNH